MSPTRRTLLRSAALALPILTLLSPTSPAHAAVDEGQRLRGLIAKATRLSVLSDRLTRSQAQRTLNVLRSRADRVMTDSTAEAKRLLQELSYADMSATAKTQYQQAGRSYVAFLDNSTRFDAQDRAALARLAVEADEVGEVVDKLVEQLIADLKQPVATVLATTADLQRLTQDLAVHYLLARAGINEAEQQQRLGQLRPQFAQHLGELHKSTLKTAGTELLLQLLDNQWTLMNQALNLQSRDGSALENICTTSERTLEVLTQLYPQYETILKTSGAE